MKGSILRLLQIFENETDNDNGLTKQEILQILQEDGYSMEEKQFYRKIDELKENGYDITIRKGKQTRYYMRKNRLTKEEWIFLVTLIAGSKDLSARETKHILDSLEGMSVCLKSLDYANGLRNRVTATKSPISQLKNFHEIIRAIDEKRQVCCKQIIDVSRCEFSSTKQFLPTSFGAKDNRIVIDVVEDGKNNSYFLGELIDVETI